MQSSALVPMFDQHKGTGAACVAAVFCGVLYFTDAHFWTNGYPPLAFSLVRKQYIIAFLPSVFQINCEWGLRVLLMARRTHTRPAAHLPPTLPKAGAISSQIMGPGPLTHYPPAPGAQQVFILAVLPRWANRSGLPARHGRYRQVSILATYVSPETGRAWDGPLLVGWALLATCSF